jgi:hypothetical protein
MRAALFALVLIACKSDADPGSCYRERDNACVDYGRAQAAAGKRLCTGYRWTPGEGTCPKDGRIGTCARDGRDEFLYSGPPNQLTPSAAKTICESGGGVFRP